MDIQKPQSAFTYLGVLGFFRNVLTAAKEAKEKNPLSPPSSHYSINNIFELDKEEYNEDIHQYFNPSSVNEKQVLKFFMENFSEKQNKSIIILCVRYNRIDLLQWLEVQYPQKIKKITEENNNNIIFVMSKYPYKEFKKTLQWAMKNGFDINKKTKNQLDVLTGLLLEEREKDFKKREIKELYKKIKLLFNNGFDLQKVTLSRNDTLFNASLFESKEILELLCTPKCITSGVEVKSAIKKVSSYRFDYKDIKGNNKWKLIEPILKIVSLNAQSVQEEVQKEIQEMIKKTKGFIDVKCDLDWLQVEALLEKYLLDTQKTGKVNDQPVKKPKVL